MPWSLRFIGVLVASVPALASGDNAGAPAPGPVERTCAPWDGPATEFAAKAGDVWLIADIWRAPASIEPGKIELGDAKTGSVRICRERIWTGQGSCRVVRRGQVTVSTATNGFYAGSIEAEDLKANFEGRLPEPERAKRLCG
jgi:hypothetical protein